jgi:hypothetical protein
MKRAVLIASILLLLLASWFGYHSWHNRKTTALISLETPKSAEQNQTIEIPLTIFVPSSANAAEFYFSFPKDLIEITDIKKDGSIFQLWVKDSPSFDNNAGTIYLAGGSPTPGFSGGNLHIGTIVVKAKAPGRVQIQLNTAKSRILANDGLGTLIPSTYQTVTMSIQP